jgi:hypothetical protein
MSVMTQVDYEEMLERLLNHIGERHNINFSSFSLANFEQHQYRIGDWTYSIDSSFEVTLCRWFGSMEHICEEVPSPTPIVTLEEEAKFEEVLKKTVEKLLQQKASSEE